MRNWHFCADVGRLLVIVMTFRSWIPNGVSSTPLSEANELQEVTGVHWAAQLPMAVTVFLSFEPSPAQIQSLHDYLRGWVP